MKRSHNLGAFLGPLLAIVLLFYFNVPIRNIFYIAIIPGLLAVIMVFFVKEPPARRAYGPEGKIYYVKAKLDAKLFKFPKEYWKYLGITAVFGIGNISSSFMILQTKNIGIPLIGTILIYALFNLVAALVSYPSGFLSDKFGRKYVLFFAFVIFAISLIGFTVTKSFVVITILFALYGVFQGIFRAVGKAYASDFAPQKLRAGAIGWYNTVVGVSGLIASVMAGQIYDRIGHATVFATALIFVVIGSTLLFFNKENYVR